MLNILNTNLFNELNTKMLLLFVQTKILRIDYTQKMFITDAGLVVICIYRWLPSLAVISHWIDKALPGTTNE